MEPGMEQHWSPEANNVFIEAANTTYNGPTRFDYEIPIPRETLMYWTRSDLGILRGLANANPEMLTPLIVLPFAEMPELTDCKEPIINMKYTNHL